MGCVEYKAGEVKKIENNNKKNYTDEHKSDLLSVCIKTLKHQQ